METKHTPGPWFVFRTTLPSQFGVTLNGDGEWEANGWRDGEYMKLSGPCREADAQLMAAAPDLLKALEDARDRISDLRDPLYGPWDDKLKREIDAAIAKATTPTTPKGES